MSPGKASEDQTLSGCIHLSYFLNKDYDLLVNSASLLWLLYTFLLFADSCFCQLRSGALGSLFPPKAYLSRGPLVNAGQLS